MLHSNLGRLCKLAWIYFMDIYTYIYVHIIQGNLAMKPYTSWQGFKVYTQPPHKLYHIGTD